MSDRNPSDLSPAMQTAYAGWEADMKVAGIDHILTCTLRLQAEQDALWAEGRELQDGVWIETDPSAVRTWTQHSRHETGDAFDFCIMVNGKCDWNMLHKDEWDKAVEIGKAHGLSQVIGKDGKVKEFAHLQLG
jgi:hypothetical protein